jgi:hypothetical protein
MRQRIVRGRLRNALLPEYGDTQRENAECFAFRLLPTTGASNMDEVDRDPLHPRRVKKLKKIAIEEKIKAAGRQKIRASGSCVAIQVLLDVGADLHARDNNGRTALHHAECNARFEVILLLRRAEALMKGELKVAVKAAVAGEPERLAIYTSAVLGWELIEAADIGHTVVVKVLLEAGAGTETKDNDSSAALIRAARSGRDDINEMAKVLVEGRAELQTIIEQWQEANRAAKAEILAARAGRAQRAAAAERIAREAAEAFDAEARRRASNTQMGVPGGLGNQY